MKTAVIIVTAVYVGVKLGLSARRKTLNLR